MADTKTKPTGASIDAYLASKAGPEQLTDCKALMAICERVTNEQPKMWGPSIVSYGAYRYRYESGHSGETCLVGFAVRGKDLVVYITAESPEQVARLAKLGKHKMGKSCLYISDGWRTSMSRSLKHSSPDRSRRSGAVIRATATLRDSAQHSPPPRPPASTPCERTTTYRSSPDEQHQIAQPDGDRCGDGQGPGSNPRATSRCRK